MCTFVLHEINVSSNWDTWGHLGLWHWQPGNLSSKSCGISDRSKIFVSWGKCFLTQSLQGWPPTVLPLVTKRLVRNVCICLYAWVGLYPLTIPNHNYGSCQHLPPISRHFLRAHLVRLAWRININRNRTATAPWFKFSTSQRFKDKLGLDFPWLHQPPSAITNYLWLQTFVQESTHLCLPKSEQHTVSVSWRWQQQCWPHGFSLTPDIARLLSLPEMQFEAYWVRSTGKRIA